MQNHSEIAEFLWKIADLIKDDYDAKDYENVILPFTLLRRLDCVLEASRGQVREAAGKYSTQPANTREMLLTKASGQRFYNTSEYSLAELTKYPNDLGQNFGAYLAGFSANVKDIFYNFSGGEEKGLSPIYETLLRKRLLLQVTKAFAEAPLDPATVDNHGMGTIFEYLIRKFKEASNEAAGQFYTPRDIIKLMVRLLFEPDRDKLSRQKLVSIYDPACGTGGMLSIAKDYLQAAVNSDLDVYLFGQELNEKTFAICKADMLMKGENPDAVKRENTLSHDLMPGLTFNYMLSNPPFGKDWKNIRDDIDKEHELGDKGRYGPGLPDVGDGAMLFLLHKLSKMDENGSKIAVIFNGSPLFNGDAGGGPSNIRRHILENDWLDAIIALPNDLFYNTGIATYIWLINNRKPEQRHGKVQLINANGPEFYTLLRRNLGKKRVEISEDQAAAIFNLYEAFENSSSGETGADESAALDDAPSKKPKLSLIFDTADFGYTKITVERPLRLRYDLKPEQRTAAKLDKEFLKLKDERADLMHALERLAHAAPFDSPEDFFGALAGRLKFKLSPTLKAALSESLDDGRALDAAALTRTFEHEDVRELRHDRTKLAGALDALADEAPFRDDAAFFKALGNRVGFRFTLGLKKMLRAMLGVRDETAEPVLDEEEQPIPDSELRDFENIPLKEDIDEYFRREVLPHVPDAWMDRSKDKVGYEISFTKYFYEYTPLRSTAEIAAELLNLDEETENLLREIVRS